MKVDYEISIQDNSFKLKADWQKKSKKILTMIGLKAVEIWKKIITDKGVVDTGRFRNSAKSVPFGKKYVIIGSETLYAPYLEYGTRKMAKRPTLKPAIMDYKDTYKAIAKKVMEE